MCNGAWRRVAINYFFLSLFFTFSVSYIALGLINQISKLKDEINKKEIECQKEISRATTISDRETMDLRRRVDKLSVAHMEEIEEIRAAHSEEVGQ